MHSLNPLTNFSGGEWSPNLDARTDIEQYRAACRQLRNLIPLKQGGATRRPGTQFMATGIPSNRAYGPSAPSVSRLDKFQFAPGTTYMLEFGDNGIRFFSNGAQVQAATPSAWNSGTTYVAGNFVTYSGQTYYALAFSIGSVPSGSPTIWRQQTAYEIPSPYIAQNFTAPNYWQASVFSLQFQQINDVIYITSPFYPVFKLTRYSDSPPNWTIQRVQFLTPAMLDQNATDLTLTASVTSGSGQLTATAPNWVTGTYYTQANAVTQGGLIYYCTQIHTSGTFETDLANGLWTLATIFTSQNAQSYWQLAYNRAVSEVDISLTADITSSPLQLIGTWEVQTYGTWDGTISLQASYDGGTTYQVITTLTSGADANFNITGQDIAGGIYQLVYTNAGSPSSATPPRAALVADNQFVYGLVQMVTINNAYSANITVVTPLLNTNPTPFWSEGAWSGRRGYPTAVTTFQERMWYGGTSYQAQRIWATQTNDLENFALVDQSQATYGLTFDLNAAGRGPIQWLAAQTDIFVGLAGAEWVLTSGQSNAAITPTAIIALEHSANGSAPGLPGEIIGNACFYVQRRGTVFEQMLFSIFTNKYMSQDMQLLAQHLTAAGIKQFDYQQQFQSQSLLWAVCGDGSLISLTYALEQKILAWAKHTTGAGTDFGFLSVQVIYGPNGQDDEVWVSTQRSGQTTATIERIDPTDWQTFNAGQPQVNEMCYLDCSTTTVTPGSSTISGLPSLLNGRTVGATIAPAGFNSAYTANGLVVSDGAVTIPNYVPASGDVVVVGLPILWTLQPMRLDFDPRAGPTQTVKKAISKLYPRVLNSLGGNWGTLEGEIIPFPNYPINQTPGQPPPFLANQPTEIELDTAILTQYADDPWFTILGMDGLPMTILSITVNYDIQTGK